MRLVELSILYLLIGVGVMLVARATPLRPGPLDLALVTLLWPLFGPLVLLQGRSRRAVGRADQGRSAQSLEVTADAADVSQLVRELKRRLQTLDVLLEAHGEGRPRCASDLLPQRPLMDSQILSRVRALRATTLHQLETIEALSTGMALRAELIRLTGLEHETERWLAGLSERMNALDAALEVDSAGLQP